MFEEIFIGLEYYFKASGNKPIIIDGGSNIGMALLFFKKLYPNAEIIAFEPDKKTFIKLKENVEANHLKNVMLQNKAISDTEGTINFYYDPDKPGSLSMSTSKERLPKECEQVEATLLSNYIKEKVDFLKLDIEGAENLVIEELANQNKLKFINVLAIEYHHHIETRDDRLSMILKILEENGFGYQINSYLREPFKKENFQDILIYAYQKGD